MGPFGSLVCSFPKSIFLCVHCSQVSDSGLLGLLLRDTALTTKMHTQLILKNLANDTKVNDLVTLTVTFILKIANLDFVVAGGIRVVAGGDVLSRWDMFSFLIN